MKQKYKDDLVDIIPLNSGGSYALMEEMLNIVRMLKYVQGSDLKEVNPRFSKICSKKKLTTLADRKYLEVVNDLFTIGKIGLELLMSTDIPKWTYKEYYHTPELIKIMREPDFHTFLYPQFPKENPYIIPDALIVFRGKKLKLQFLEIEAEKPNWDSYLEKKRQNYLKLARDKQVYTYWFVMSKKFQLPCPPIEEFYFSVRFTGCKKDWGEGFVFGK